ncbi:MAG: DUF2190 family protein [Alphaproteobacteria bacterium]|nr:DUF2190 family protein [Alphaproteobacteria bacterium]
MSEQLLIKAFPAYTNISPRRAIKLTDDGVTQASSASDVVIGISHQQLSVSAGQHADIVMVGIIEADAGGVFSVSSKLTSDGDGKLVKASDGDNIIAIALEEATAINDVIRVLITHS